MSTLVTKLSESINNPLLKKIDEIVYPISPSVADGNISYYNKYVSADIKGGTARLVGGGHFVDSQETDIGTEVQLDPMNWDTLRIRNAAGNKLFVSGKDRLVRCICQLDTPFIHGLDINQLSYCDSISVLKITDSKATGNLSALSRSRSLVDVRLSGGIKGDLGIFSDYTSITSLILENNIELSGDIVSLKKNIGMTRLFLNLQNHPLWDFDALADGMVDEGRVSGELRTLNTDNTVVTYTFSSGGWTKG